MNKVLFVLGFELLVIGLFCFFLFNFTDIVYLRKYSDYFLWRQDYYQIYKEDFKYSLCFIFGILGTWLMVLECVDTGKNPITIEAVKEKIKEGVTDYKDWFKD